MFIQFIQQNIKNKSTSISHNGVAYIHQQIVTVKLIDKKLLGITMITFTHIKNDLATNQGHSVLSLWDTNTWLL